MLAVIFDMDGVLIDSYQAHFQSWQAMAAEAGLTLTLEQFGITFGRTSREIIAALWQDRRLSEEDVLALDNRKEALFRQILERDFPAMPGVRELLQEIHDAGLALAVGSSGPPENVELALERLGDRSLWGAVVTGRDVTRGKPDPQVFSLAAERLGIVPGRCVVVEDARPGVAAAKAAGMACIGLASTGHKRCELSQADRVVDSLDEISLAMLRAAIRQADAGPPRCPA